MKKIIVIDDCGDCPHFDNSYWGYNEECQKLKRRIPMKRTTNKYVYSIPNDCPLPNKEENMNG